MIVPTPCRGAKCKIDSEANFGQDETGVSNPLCESLFKQATNMMDAGVCANKDANENPTDVTKPILHRCGGNVPEAEVFKSPLNPQTKQQVHGALACTLDECAVSINPILEPLQKEWRDGQMRKCLDDSQNKNHPYPADNCVSSARPLDCEKQENVKECKDFYVRFKALNKVCKPITSSSASSCKWKTPKQLTQEKLRECFLNMECDGKNSKKTLSEGCLKRCYDINDDKEAQLQDKLDKCFTSKDCDGAPTKKATTASTAPGPAPSTIKPADQGNNDNGPTSMAPKDQDVTSDEDEGCMVRANKKIIITFAATFVVISFLKALPVEN